MITKYTFSANSRNSIGTVSPRRFVNIQHTSPSPIYLAVDGSTGVTSFTGLTPGIQLNSYASWSNEQSFSTDWLQSRPIIFWADATGIAVIQEI
jgi:hypothetical protein